MTRTKLRLRVLSTNEESTYQRDRKKNLLVSLLLDYHVVTQQLAGSFRFCDSRNYVRRNFRGTISTQIVKKLSELIVHSIASYFE